MTNESTRPDVLIVQGRMERGYGIIPKIPMQDPRLTIEAKAIYSYFCSYAGAGSTAFPSRAKILNDLQIGETRFYKHFNLLKKHGYVTVEQNTDNTGKFKNNIYTLVEMIEPYRQNRGTEPYPHFTGTDNPCTENEGTKNNSFKNISLKINNTCTENQQSKSKSDEPNLKEEKTDMTMTVDCENVNKKEILEKEKEPSKISTDQSTEFKESPLNDFTTYRQIIQDNIEYNHYLTYRSGDIEEVDELINCMLDVICTQGATVKINGEQKNREMVKSQYLKITSMDIDHILDRYKEQRHKITHVHAYLKTMLYTCKQENGHYYTNAVRADGLVS